MFSGEKLPVYMSVLCLSVYDVQDLCGFEALNRGVSESENIQNTSETKTS